MAGGAEKVRSMETKKMGLKTKKVNRIEILKREVEVMVRTRVVMMAVHR